MANRSTFQLRFLKNRSLDHGSLRLYMRAGLRRGTWSGLSRAEKALYRCGLWVAKARGRITSLRLSMSLHSIIMKLVATVRSRINALGLARVRSLRKRYISAGVFDWAPEVNVWLSRADFIMYLGVMELNV